MILYHYQLKNQKRKIKKDVVRLGNLYDYYKYLLVKLFDLIIKLNINVYLFIINNYKIIVNFYIFIINKKIRFY